MARSNPGGFTFSLYADQASARSAIEEREVYGAFAATQGHITVLEASAASPTVSQLLTSIGQKLARQAASGFSRPGAAGDPGIVRRRRPDLGR